MVHVPHVRPPFSSSNTVVSLNDPKTSIIKYSAPSKIALVTSKDLLVAEQEARHGSVRQRIGSLRSVCASARAEAMETHNAA